MDPISSPAAVLEQQKLELNDIARTGAQCDAEAHIHPDVPGLTPGELGIRAGADLGAVDLGRAQDAELAAAQVRASGLRQAISNPAGSPSPEVRSVRVQRLVPWELIGLCPLGAIEWSTLRPPVATILNTGGGDLIAAAFVVFPFMLAAFVAEQWSRARHSVGWERRPHVRATAVLVAAMAVIGLGAVLARIYSADMASLIAGVSSSPFSLAFFICLQVVFAVVSLAGAISLRTRMDRARVASWSEERDRLEAFIDGTAPRHSHELNLLHRQWREAWLVYRRRLGELHPNPGWQLQWQQRTSLEGDTDEGPRLVFPGIGPAPSPTAEDSSGSLMAHTPTFPPADPGVDSHAHGAQVPVAEAGAETAVWPDPDDPAPATDLRHGPAAEPVIDLTDGAGADPQPADDEDLIGAILGEYGDL